MRFGRTNGANGTTAAKPARECGPGHGYDRRSVRLRAGWFAGTGPFLWIGLALALVGTLSLVGTTYSSSWLLWTGQPVRGTEQGGIVYYSYRGVNYNFDDTGSQQLPGSSQSRVRTVYVDPSDPSNAILDSTVARIIDVVTVVGPFLAAMVFVAVGFRRKRRNNRRRRSAAAIPPEERFGEGLDHDLVQRLLAQQKADGWQAVTKPPRSDPPTWKDQP
jgi:hypothetical protein